MTAFLFLLRPSGAPITDAERARYVPPPPFRIAQHPAQFKWFNAGCCSAGVCVDRAFAAAGLGPACARASRLIGVGNVRLDNRDEVQGWVNDDRLQSASDLDLLLAALEARGPRCIPSLLGDIALVVWDPTARNLLCIRDVTGIKQLFFAESPDLFAVASHASVIASSDEYDLQFIADYLADGLTNLDRTVFAGVTAIRPGTTLSYHNRTTAISRYWSADDFVIDDSLSRRPEEQIERFSNLFAEAVRLRLTGRDDTWAMLSGGLDSSSVVCMAQTLIARGDLPLGVSGTVTIADTLGDGDERDYVASVIDRWQLRNEEVVDYGLWQDDGEPPPLTEAPNPQYPFYARDRRTCAAVHDGGGRVLLSGLGADHYLTGNDLFFADWIAQRRVRAACHEMVRWAVSRRTSFWQLAWESGLRPLLPGSIYRRVAPAHASLAPWIDPTFARRFDLRSRPFHLAIADAPRGRKYVSEIAHTVRLFGFGYDTNIIFTSFDLRCPFLYRPLLEFALQLPAELRSTPHGGKWILRQAMRGILPEKVRQRTSKGGPDARVVSSLAHEQGRIKWLLADSIVAERGWIDPKRLAEGIAGAVRGDRYLRPAVLRALGLETWLRVRAGRWATREPAQYQRASA